MDATDSSPRRTSSIIRRFSSIERSRLPPRVSVCFASSSVDVSISSPKWTRTPCPSLRTHHRRMRCQGSDGGDRTLTELGGRILEQLPFVTAKLTRCLLFERRIRIRHKLVFAAAPQIVNVKSKVIVLGVRSDDVELLQERRCVVFPGAVGNRVTDLGLGRLQAWLRGVPSPHESRRSDRELLVEYGLQSSAILKPRVSRVKNTADHRSAGVPFFGLLLYAKK